MGILSNSALSERVAPPFSEFRTPFINTGRLNDADEEDEVFGIKQFVEELDTHGQQSFAQRGVADLYDDYYDPYPSWSSNKEIPITRDRIQFIFVKLSKLFGFQYDNARNMYDYFMRLLDSRASRMGPSQALKTLHADYIGGENSNYKKWYFGAQMDIADYISAAGQEKEKLSFKKVEKEFPLPKSQNNWAESMKQLSTEDRVVQLAIYLMIWGEANVVRFMPECVCFLFKCCIDIFYSLDFSSNVSPLATSFLDHAITPIYTFYRDELYEKKGDSYVLRDRDHAKIIGYDDINQTFWFKDCLEKIQLKSKQRLFEIPAQARFLYLDQIEWKKSIRKTYYEYRSWYHAIIDFNRIWNIHIGMFWYYTCFNCKPLYTPDYDVSVNNQPNLSVTFSLLSLAGSIVSFVNLISLAYELVIVPRRWPGAIPMFSRISFTLLLFIINTAPTIYILVFFGISKSSKSTLTISMIQFIISIFTVCYCSIVPLSMLTFNPFKSQRRKFLPNIYFTNSICQLQGKRILASYGLWIGVFASKFLESYFFLTLSLKDPIRELSLIKIDHCIGEQYFGSFLCSRQPIILMVLLFATSMTLFFLDTYLWFIIWNTAFSICRAFYCGVSIWTPWKNMFVLLPKRIGSKIISPSVMVDASTVTKNAIISKIWNSIIISLYREHLISIDHLEHLIYQFATNEKGEKIITEPLYFIETEDNDNLGFGGDITISPDCEASRRLSFFAHSMSTPMPKAPSVNEMPSFSVLIPHYAEKITLSLHEIVRKESEHSNLTLLEYLKQLYPDEWHNFVRDTKLLAAEKKERREKKIHEQSDMDSGDLPYYAVGFKTATPEYILRTRIWASLRSQTLFRTISGFMNYSRALKLLYTTESGDPSECSNQKKSEEANVLAERKFRIVTSLQKMCDFDEEQEEAKELLLRTYPELQISYLEIVIDPETKEKTYYSALIDGFSDVLANGKRKPKYRIRLSGNPILGDGKSDNQNHTIIFCRGEYCQLIDANQDNYLEECLKIRNLLMEFEEVKVPADVYGPVPTPVAIVGTREYIFSENVGVLGDVAAGKEQTFGTLSARTMAFVGGKLHYGHPDLLNTVFMTTRGGYSKSQKGLHLNEDIYAGINALLRSGQIKHCEYLQCGKGRDLGFSSILNFTTKIGSGMSEQMLSREYFYLGTQMKLDRFLSFYYAHPGFHMNNVFIMLSLKLFMLFCINLATLTESTVICSYNKDVPFTDKRKPLGCHNLIPVIDWVQRCVLSIFIVFGISFLPLCIQELMERGVWKCCSRIGRHFISLSPMFEVFVCRVYSKSLVNDFSLGGAKYIATGRGFSTIRMPFYKLYARFSHESFYLAASLTLMLLYTSIVMWKISLLYFWCTVLSLLLSPFWFNPEQFSFSEFFIDYRRFLQWLTGGNILFSSESWITHIRDLRMQSTGSKNRRHKKMQNEQNFNQNKKPSFLGLIFTQLVPTLLVTLFICAAFIFSNAQNGIISASPANSILRLVVISFGPIILNMGILLLFFIVSLITGPVLSCCTTKVAALMANITHFVSVANYLLFLDFLFLCQNWDISRTLLGVCACCSIETLTFKALIIILNREFKADSANKSWWTGTWFNSGLGWHILTQPLREFGCKTIELSLFACDFLVSHILLLIQFPLLFIPYMNKLHSFLLLWLKHEGIIGKPVYSRNKRRIRERTTISYFVVFALINIIIIGVVIVPYIAVKAFNVDFDSLVPEFAVSLLQPLEDDGENQGLKNYISFTKDI
ncbi:hypothetical protein HII13_005019 [Brettanomyces bruxellensis]|uniref:1,3-beta-glucan synthase n=1 Tax=Dekkera bruxellensis TaxID=5007 RepID=A0A7D9H789_DEKBR|nr:hypothetical protein HII13_005019 [Brettanomyces bruxellensis]VUG20225.1 FKS1 [Brettanomyces bruxellensis]